jgi:serine phosphatase RsbU (regulator of sigma subunit)
MGAVLGLGHRRMVIALFAEPEDARTLSGLFAARGHACLPARDSIPAEADCLVCVGERCPRPLLEAAERAGLPSLRLPREGTAQAAAAAAWALRLADDRSMDAARSDARVARLEQEIGLEAARAEARVRRLESMRVRLAEQRSHDLAAANSLLERRASELSQAMARLDGANKLLVNEMNLAAELQKSLLPRSYPKDAPLEFAHKFIPLDSIGGDYFDVVRLDEKTLGLVIADVSGHGVGPALVAAMFKSSFALVGKAVRSPARLMAALNAEMNGFLTTGHYVTAFAAFVDLETLEMCFTSAGHPKQLLVRADGRYEELTTQGFLLGMVEGMDYEEKRLVLEPGDTLVLFTDGVIETPDSGGGMFGREGIVRSVLARLGSGPGELSAGLFSDLLTWGAGTEAQDDVTILMAQVLESL